jgi:hypothetical protein
MRQTGNEGASNDQSTDQQSNKQSAKSVRQNQSDKHSNYVRFVLPIALNRKKNLERSRDLLRGAPQPMFFGIGFDLLPVDAPGGSELNNLYANRAPQIRPSSVGSIDAGKRAARA